MNITQSQNTGEFDDLAKICAVLYQIAPFQRKVYPA